MPRSPENSSLQVELSNRQILKMALPISLAMLVPQLNFVANTIFLSYDETILGTAGKLDEVKAGDSVRVAYMKTGTSRLAEEFAVVEAPAKRT